MKPFVLATGILLALVYFHITTVDAGPTQPQDPIIAIVSEPVTHEECVSMYQQLLLGGRHHHHQQQQQEFLANLGRQALKKMKTDQQDGQLRGKGRLLGGSNNNTLPPVPGESGCIWGLYVDWLEASGIRVLPLPWDASEEKMMYILERVNGVLLAGGILGWVPSKHNEFFQVAGKIYNYVIERNLFHDDPMVMWGTCQGFEMLNAAAAASIFSGGPGASNFQFWNLVQPGFKGMEPLMMKVNFTEPWVNQSKMFGGPQATSDYGKKILDYMHTQDTTLNWHSYGIPPEEYQKNNNYSSASCCLNSSGLRPLSTTNDVAGRTFTSSVESVHGPIFGVQFHPERVMFELNNGMITHQPQAIEVSEYLGNFLVTQLRGNNHTFENPSDAEKLLIANYPRFNLGYGIRIYNI